MQNHHLFTIAAALAASFTLAACNSQPETIVAGNNDPDAATLNATKPVELPPMLTASHAYRCKDNSLVYIDFMSNNTALYRTEKEGAAVQLKMEEAGKPYTAEGYSVSGNGTAITLTAPGKGTTDCKA